MLVFCLDIQEAFSPLGNKADREIVNRFINNVKYHIKNVDGYQGLAVPDLDELLKGNDSVLVIFEKNGETMMGFVLTAFENENGELICPLFRHLVKFRTKKKMQLPTLPTFNSKTTSPAFLMVVIGLLLIQQRYSFEPAFAHVKVDNPLPRPILEGTGFVSARNDMTLVTHPFYNKKTHLDLYHHNPTLWFTKNNQFGYELACYLDLHTNTADRELFDFHGMPVTAAELHERVCADFLDLPKDAS